MNKEELSGLNKSNRAAIVIMMVLVVAGLAWSITGFFFKYDILILPTKIANLVMYILVGYYGLWGCRKPHGNLLKYLILLYGVSFIPYICRQGNNQTYQIIFPLIILLIGYMAGRLYKFHENQIISIIVTILLLFVYAIRTFGPESASRDLSDIFNLIGPLNQVVIWLAICAAYFSRYQLHKEAGLQDKPA